MNSSTKNKDKNMRWLFLTLCGLTNAIVLAAPSMALSVLLPEISIDLDLTIVQAGFVWGIGALPSIFSSMIAGTLMDRFGSKRIITITCLLLGGLGISRGLSTDYPSLLITVFLFGFFTPFISVGNIKNARNWFEDHELGLANGILALGMAFGFFLGSMISASFLSPWLGGWQNTFIFYGIIAILFMIPWFFAPTSTGRTTIISDNHQMLSVWGSIKHILEIKNIWLLGFSMLCLSGGVQGFLGYLPLYLRHLGWQDIKIGSIAASFHLASMLFVIPLTILSDKLNTRKKFALTMFFMIALGIGMVSFLNGQLLWLAVVISGFTRDATMAILFTMTLETKGVGITYSGIASGLMMIFAGLGSLIFPPLGNKFSVVAFNSPLIFWSASCFIGLLFLASRKSPQISTR